MASRRGGARSSRSLRVRDNYFLQLWDENIKGILFGVLYTMTKENTLPNVFVILSIVLEFFQIIIFCFRTNYYWGGLSVDTNVNISFIGYTGFLALFWIVVGLIVLASMNAAYVGYSFHKGEMTSIHLMRTLRWICSLMVSVLFIPILSVLLTGIACDYTESPPTLVMYPSHQCWSASHAPISVVGIIVLIFFSVFSLFTGLTYYEFDPSIINASGRLQNRFEFGSLWLKMLLVFFNFFLDKHPMAMAAALIFIAIALFVGHLVMLPAYENKLNLMRSASFGGVFWVTICLFISYGIKNPDNYASVIIVVVGLPFALALGAFVADRRLKYICNPNLVDETEEDNKRKPVKKASKVVKWEQPSKVNVQNKLADRLIFPTDVEIAARFVLTSKPNLALIEKAKTVYITGLHKFPKSASVMQGYVNFIFTVLGDWQLGYTTLEKLRKMKPKVDIQFFIYRYDKDREQRSDGGRDVGDFVSYLEFKRMRTSARRFHELASRDIRKFWRKLEEPKVDVLELSDLSTDIAFTQKKAAELYQKILTHHPKNIRVLRDYAKFLDEIMNDSRAAKEIWKKADKYETREMEKMTDSHRSPSSPVIGDNDSDFRSEADTEQSTEFYDDATSTASSGVAAGLVLATRERIQRLTALSWIMFFTTLFALLYGFIQLGVVNSQLNQYDRIVQALDAAGGLSTGSVQLATDLLDTFSLAIQKSSTGNYTSYDWVGDHEDALASAKTSTFIMENSMKALYWGTSDLEPFTSQRRRVLKIDAGYKLDVDPSLRSMTHKEFNGNIPNKRRIVSFFEDPNLRAYYGLSFNASTQLESDFRSVDLWSLGMMIAGFMKDLVKQPISQFLTSVDSISMSIFVLTNLTTFARGTFAFLELCGTLVGEKLSLILLVSAITFGIAVAALLLTAGGIYRRVVSSIFSYKVKTLQMFTIIPSHIVKFMSKKKISSLGHEGDSSDDGMSDGEEDRHKYNYKEKTPERVVAPPPVDLITPMGPATPPPGPPEIVLPATLNTNRSDGSEMIESSRTPRGTETSWTPRGTETVKTPRGTLIIKTPRGSEFVRTPRGLTDDQKQTLLLHPNSCERDGEEEEEEDEDEDEFPDQEDTFKNLKSSAEMRIRKEIAKAVTKESPNKEREGNNNNIIVDNPVEYEVGSSSKDSSYKGPKKRHSSNLKPHDVQIEMKDLKASTNSESDSPQKVRSFRDKLSLSIIPTSKNVEDATPLISSQIKPFKSTSESMPAIEDNNNNSNNNNNNAINNNNNKSKSEKKIDPKNRMTVSSLRGVVLKVHFTYMFAIACFIATILASFVLTRDFVDNLKDIATDMKTNVDSGQRAYLLVHFGTRLAFIDSGISGNSIDTFAYLLQEGYGFGASIKPKDYQMDFMYSETCMRVNKSKCPDESYEFYDEVKYGFAQLYFSFLTEGQNILALRKKGTLTAEHPSFRKFKMLAGNDVYDGLATLTFLSYEDAMRQIASAKKSVGITTGISSAIYILIHLIIFRPFVKRLREESEHIYVILNMIPRKMLSEVPEIMEFLYREADI